MRIKYHRQFKKNFKKRIAFNQKLMAKFEKRLSLRIKNPEAGLLKDHQLVGKLSQYRAFSVTGDIRVIYWIEGGVMYLYDIGSHNQVY